MQLSDLTTLRLGGPAGRLVVCEREEEIVAIVRDADRAGEALLPLAGGSNLVVPDDGFPGTVALIRSRGIERQDAGEHVSFVVQAGEPWDVFVERCVTQGFSGLECLSGIPGSVGATPMQNVGAYGQEVRETISRVRAYDRVRDETFELANEECGFSYRSSAFKRAPGRWVVLSATFALRRQSESAPVRYAELARALGISPGQSAPLTDVRSTVLALRRSKGMVLDPDDPDTVSAGSFFLNPVLTLEELERLQERAREQLGSDVRLRAFPDPDGHVKVSAAWLIEQAGFHRGFGNPEGIALSSKHTLALTNRGHGTTRELLALAGEIVEGVRDRFGVTLHPEPVIVGGTLPAWARVHSPRLQSGGSL